MWLTWANALTALRLALIAPLVLAVIHGVWTVAAGLFTLAVLTDYFDGPLARHHGQATPIGGFMDHVGNDGSGAAWTARRSEMFGTELRRPDDFSPAAGPGSSGEVD